MSKPKSIRRGIISNRASDSTETLGFMQKEIARLTQLLDEACKMLAKAPCVTKQSYATGRVGRLIETASQGLRDYYGARRSQLRKQADVRFDKPQN